MVALLLVAAFFRLYRLNSPVPGVIVDAGFIGLDMRDVLAGHWHIFFPNATGHEALFIYWGALIIWLGGANPFALEFATVSMNLLGVAAAFRCFKALFGWRISIVASMLFAVSFWMVNVGRLVYTANSLPVFLLATIYLLWRTLRTGKRKYAVLGGLALGLTLYTYLASRALPLLIVLICLAEWRLALRRWRPLLIFTVIALLIVAPEAIYLVLHPTIALERVDMVALNTRGRLLKGAGTTPVQGFLNVAGMFFIKGDMNGFANIPGRPVFDPLTAAFFAAGLAIAIFESRRNARYRWPLLWLVVMSLPSALSLESPHSVRLYGMAPVTFLFPALAFAPLWDTRGHHSTEDRESGRLAPGGVGSGGQRALNIASVAVATAIVAGNGVSTFGLYFGQFQTSSANYRMLQGNQTKLAQFVATQPESTMYFSDGEGTAVRFLDPNTQNQGWFQEESTAVPLPPHVSGDILYVAAPNAALKDTARLWLPGLEALPSSPGPDGAPDFWAFRWPAASARRFLSAQRPLPANMKPDFRLVSYEPVRLPGRLVMNLIWQQLRADGPYDMFVHLIDRRGKPIAQADRLVWPVKRIHGSLDFDQVPSSDDLLLTQHELSAPPGTYVAEIGVAHRLARDRSQLVGGPIGEVARVTVTIR